MPTGTVNSAVNTMVIMVPVSAALMPAISGCLDM